MVIRGRVQNGVVVLEDGTSLPEGVEVTVVAPAAPASSGGLLSEAEHRRVLEAIGRIAAMPIEGASEPFSGREHDRVLYGSPE